MEIYEYFKAIKNNWKIFVAIVLIVTGLVFILTKRQQDQYEGMISLTIMKKNMLSQEDINFFLYENYYAMESSGLYVDTIENWLHSAGIVKSIYDQAGLKAPELVLKDYSKVFQSKTSTETTNVLNVTTQTKNKKDCEKLLKAMVEVVQKENLRIAKDDPQRSYDIFASRSLIVIKKPAIFLSSLAALILSSILALMVVIFLQYLKKRR